MGQNVDPLIEWFIQCADIKISSSSTRSWESFNSFSMIDNDGIPAYPSSISSYRNPYNPLQAAPEDAEFFMTGPACVDNSINQCDLTAVGTRGYTGFGGDENVEPLAPSQSTTAIVPYMTSSPTSDPSTSLQANAMCCYAGGCSSYGTSNCNPLGSWCSSSAESCQGCGGTFCTDQVPLLTPTPTSAPTPESTLVPT